MQTTSRYASRTAASLGEGHSCIALRFGTCISDDTTDDFKSLETTLIDANIAEKIVREFHSMDKKSIVPAMLA